MITAKNYGNNKEFIMSDPSSLHTTYILGILYISQTLPAIHPHFLEVSSP